MRSCKTCKTDFKGNLDECPLCKGELTGKTKPSVFPYNEKKDSESTALIILALAAGLCFCVMLVLWQLFSLSGNVVITVTLALILNHLFVRNILLHRPDFLRVIIRYFLILLAIAAIWFLLTQNLAITTYVIPAICLTALVFDAVLIAAFRDSFVFDYAKYVLFDVLIGLVPLALVALNLTTWNVLAYISGLAACLLVFWLLIFMRKQLLAEIRKLFSL